MDRHTATAAMALFGAVSAAMPVQATEWVGRWGAPSCNANAVVIGLSPMELDLSTFETTCTVNSAKSERAGYELRATCRGEGRPVRVTFGVRVDGNTLTFVRQSGFEFDPKRFVRCR